MVSAAIIPVSSRMCGSLGLLSKSYRPIHHRVAGTGSKSPLVVTLREPHHGAVDVADGDNMAGSALDSDDIAKRATVVFEKAERV